MQLSKPIFTQEHIKYLETIFPEIQIDPADMSLPQKLLMREGEKRVLTQIKRMVLYQGGSHA